MRTSLSSVSPPRPQKNTLTLPPNRPRTRPRADLQKPPKQKGHPVVGGKKNQARPDTEDVTLDRGAEKEPMHPKEQILPKILARSAEMLHNEQNDIRPDHSPKGWAGEARKNRKPRNRDRSSGTLDRPRLGPAAAATLYVLSLRSAPLRRVPARSVTCVGAGVSN